MTVLKEHSDSFDLGLRDVGFRSPQSFRGEITCTVDFAQWKTDVESVSATGPLVVLGRVCPLIMLFIIDGLQLCNQKFYDYTIAHDHRHDLLFYFMDKESGAGTRYLAFLDLTVSIIDDDRTVYTKRLYRILQVESVVDAEQLMQADRSTRWLHGEGSVCTRFQIFLG